MRIDFELIKLILEEVSELGDGTTAVEFKSEKFGKYSKSEIAYAVNMASQMGFIGDREWLEDFDGVSVFEITAAGHNFLAESNKSEIVEFLKSETIDLRNFSWDTAKHLFKAWVKKKAKEMTDLDVKVGD
jgi:hypothetical protein